jgi:hypothetical protein
VKKENWTVKASLQKRRHLIAIKLTSEGQAEIVGVIEKHHAFRGKTPSFFAVFWPIHFIARAF